MITHYENSKGALVEIAGMPYPHLLNARDKLVRESDGSRQGEIDAMSARLAAMEEEKAAADVAGAAQPGAEDPHAEAENPRIHLGANNPPEPTAYEAIKVHIEDLMTEARNWADGAEVTSPEQAAEVDRLIEMMREALNTAEEARKAEKAPLDKQIDAIQERYNVYVAPLKNKKPGKLSLAIEALKAAVEPWRKAEARKREEAARKAREEAQAKADEAAAALRAAATSDLAAREEAEALVQEATVAARVATRTERTATTGTGLRSYWAPHLTDGAAAARHYWVEQRAACEAFFLSLAKTDVLAGKRTIPGFDVLEDRRAV